MGEKAQRDYAKIDVETSFEAYQALSMCSNMVRSMVISFEQALKGKTEANYTVEEAAAYLTEFAKQFRAKYVVNETGDQQMALITRDPNGGIVNSGDTVEDFRGQVWTFDHASRAMGNGKSGKVVVTDEFDRSQEFYDGVFGLTVRDES